MLVSGWMSWAWDSILPGSWKVLLWAATSIFWE